MSRGLAGVIRVYWEKGEGGRLRRSDVKAYGLTEEVHGKPGELRAEEDSGTRCGAVE